MRTYNVTPIFSGRTLASDLWKEMDRLFYADTNEAIYDEKGFELACDFTENHHAFMLSMDIPGMKHEDIKIEVQDDTLTVSGERKIEASRQSNTSLRREKAYGLFRRSFTLPKTVNIEKIEAFYEDGVLELFIPKEESAKPRAIAIQQNKKGLLGKLLSHSQEENKVRETH